MPSACFGLRSRAVRESCREPGDAGKSCWRYFVRLRSLVGSCLVFLHYRTVPLVFLVVLIPLYHGIHLLRLPAWRDSAQQGARFYWENL